MEDARSAEAPYAVVAALFWAGLLAVASAGRDQLDERASAADLVALGLASAQIGRVVAEDRVTVFLRRPFTTGDAAVQPRGAGLVRAAGELLTCAHCVSLWAAGFLAAGRLARPRETRVVTTVFAAHAVADAARAALRRIG